MSFDTRLLMESIPTLQNTELCDYLKSRDKQEKIIQTQEQKIFNQAMDEYRLNTSKAEICTTFGIGTIASLFFSVGLGGYIMKINPKIVLAVLGVVVLAHGAVAVCAFIGRSIYHEARTPQKEQIKKIWNLKRGRLETHIREIKERMTARDVTESEKVQLNAARDALKGNRVLFSSSLAEEL